ncbi:MAG: histidine phosphatase family protein [Burkholderiaceae bacterium]|nr:histidine phosphatase family protein [Burkholderiaceae bacterium]
MDLILWRHAEAEPETPELSDENRRLTQKGQRQAQKMAYWLDSNLPESCRILVSPTVRTRETIAALDRKFKVLQELGPETSLEAALQAINWPLSKEPVMIVGHQPTLGLIAAKILHPAMQECAIRKGNVWWITQKAKEGEGLHTYLKAIMTPDLVVK